MAVVRSWDFLTLASTIRVQTGCVRNDQRNPVLMISPGVAYTSSQSDHSGFELPDLRVPKAVLTLALYLEGA